MAKSTKTDDTSKTAVIYTRVSSDPHGAGRSVTEQEEDCRRVCEREGWEVLRVYCDNDRSASKYATKDRPAYKELRESLARGEAGVLVMWEASRAQRDLDAYVDLRNLCQAHEVRLNYSGRTYDLSKTDDVFQTGLDALLSEREASITSDRICRAVRANAQAGRPHGKLTYGYSREYDSETGSLVRQVVNEEQAKIIREAARRCLAGETPYAVAKDFNRRGIPSPRAGQLFAKVVSKEDAEREGWEVIEPDLPGGRVKARVPSGHEWNTTQVKRIVTNPAYIAKRVHKGQTVGDAQWPAILDDATFYALQSKLQDPKRKTTREGAVKHLLSGIARCGVCGGRTVVQKNRGYASYTCQASFCVSRRTTLLDAYVEDILAERVQSGDALAALSGGGDDEKDARAEARDEAERLEARLEEFYEAAATGEVTPNALAKIEAKLLPQIDQARKAALPRSLPDHLRDALLSGELDDMPLTVKREVIDALMDIELLPTRRGVKKLLPEHNKVSWRQQ